MYNRFFLIAGFLYCHLNVKQLHSLGQKFPNKCVFNSIGGTKSAPRTQVGCIVFIAHYMKLATRLHFRTTNKTSPW